MSNKHNRNSSSISSERTNEKQRGLSFSSIDIAWKTQTLEKQITSLGIPLLQHALYLYTTFLPILPCKQCYSIINPQKMHWHAQRQKFRTRLKLSELYLASRKNS